MLFSKLTWGLSLLGLVAANSLVRPLRNDTLAHPEALIVRAEEPEDFCSCTDCGKKRAPIIPRSPSWGNTILTSRAIDKPAQGQIDAWFNTQWHSNTIIEIPHDEDDYTAKFRHFEDQAFKMGLKGMCGCASVIIVSEIGGFMSHHWEKPYFTEAAAGRPAEFQAHVIHELQSSLPALKFNKNEQPKMKVGLYSKWDTSRGALKYPDQVKQIKDTVASLVPGLSVNDILDIPYYTSLSPSEDLDISEGKVILTYDPKADGKSPGVQVWAGSLRNADGSKMEAAANNAPVLSTAW